MTFQIFAIVAALGTLAGMYTLLRHGSMKEKYTLVWLLAAVATLVVAVFPALLDSLADVFHVKDGANLLFMVAGIAMMLICVQLSVEASTQAYRTRTLAEDIALLRLEVEQQRRVIDALSADNSNAPSGDGSDPVSGDDQDARLEAENK